MAVFCIPRQKIEKLKGIIKGISDKNQLDKLVEMSPEARIKAFEKQLTKDEASLLNREFERSVASEKVSALKKWVKNNLDEKYRETKISQQQRGSIKKFIEDHLYPGKGKSEIIPIEELKKMSDSDFLNVLKKNFKEGEISQIKKQFDAAAAKQTEKMTTEKKLSLQRSVVERFMAQKKRTASRVSVPMDEILKMNPEEQLKFLKGMMPEGEAITAQQNIQKISISKIDTELDAKLRDFKSLKDFSKYIDSKLPQFSAMKEGVAFSSKETEDIINLTSKIQEEKSILAKDPTNLKLQENYGMSRYELYEFISDLRGEGNRSVKETVQSAIGVQRAVQLGIDLGTTLIQGAGTITKESAWKANMQGLKNMMDKGEMKLMKARILGHPAYEEAMKAGLRLPLYGTRLFEKEEMAMFNKFKVSTKHPAVKTVLGGFNETMEFFERYVASLSQTRFDLFNETVALSKLAGNDVSLGSKELKDIANVINTISGSTHLGRFERNVPEANFLMMSARLFASKFKMLFTPAEMVEHYARKAIGKETRVSDVVMKTKMRAAMGIVGVSSGLMTLFALSGYEVETDPNSSSFGKATVGNRKIDLTLGYGSYITWMSRMLTGKTKTAEGVTKSLTDLTPEQEKAGEIRAVGSGGSPMGRGSFTGSFLRNKLATVPSVMLDYFLGETNIGKKPTASLEAGDRMPPMFLSDFWDIVQDDKMGTLEKGFTSLMSLAGIGGYTNQGNPWADKTSKEMLNFKSRVGEDLFQKANDEYNTLVNDEMRKTISSPSYKLLSNEGKQKVVTKIKDKAKNDVFIKYPTSKYPLKVAPEKKEEVARKSKESVVIKTLTK
jgi:hypothetical protein